MPDADELYLDADELYRRYRAQIEAWNWDAIVEDCRDPENQYVDARFPGDTQVIGSSYLGTVMNLYPSGKYYMPWCTNQTDDDVARDSAYAEALEDVADAHDLYVFSGEGDPCDVYVGMVIDRAEGSED